MTLPSQQAIGLFDSGVGGLTVMQEIKRLLPHERLIYFGDTARVPYGNKGTRTIVRYSIENTISLLEKNIKMMIVACNTASALALPQLRRLFNLPILGVIEPGAQKAVNATKNQRIAVLGTKATIQSRAYQKAIQTIAPQAVVIPIACPLFVPLVEERWLDHPTAQMIVREYLQPLQKEKVDTVLLGCTHYPLLSSLIRKEIGPEITLVDSASTCAEQTAALLQEKGLLAPCLQGKHQYYSSDDPEKFRALAEQLFGHPLHAVELLTPDRLNES